MRADRFSLDDTIAAIATPPGRSALALIRVSGPRARDVLSSIAPRLPRPLPERRPTLAEIVGGGALLDRALVTFFPGPRSATGEDVFEISVHGSPPVVAGTLEALSVAGARPARPGEFTERAFLLGKLDLVEAEAVGELIEARTPAAARASARRLAGELSERLHAIREDLSRAAAELAATIDFAEDVGEAVLPETPARIAAAAAELSRLAATADRGALLSEGARVALLGRPNAGKSTLFNALAGSERAIVTDIPGTTRDTLEATIDVGGVPVEIVDTAGLRPTEDPVERLGVRRAREAGAAADAVVYVFDAGAGWTTEDAAVVASLGSDRILVVANKIDTAAGPVEAPGAFRCVSVCGLSADAGAVLRGALLTLVDGGPPAEAHSAILGAARQRDAVRRASRSAEGALAALTGGDSPEYAATHVHDALDALADLVGETTAEDVLDRIFSSFCIGK